LHFSELTPTGDNISPLVNSLSGLSVSQFPERGYRTQMRYNSEWWHSANLDILVSALNPTSPMPIISVKKRGTGAYSSPTHASTMKQVDPTKLYRSASNSSRYPNSLSPSRAPSPPPPEVDWPVAAQELCKLLIPSDRQISSCKFYVVRGIVFLAIQIIKPVLFVILRIPDELWRLGCRNLEYIQVKRYIQWIQRDTILEPSL
jgi:hypothetical protein